MINIQNLINKASSDGYDSEMVGPKVCQDIILSLLESSSFKNKVTIKGGVVMRNLSKNIRRATMDLDFDLIHYPLSEIGIKNLIRELNKNNLGLTILINGKIKKLNHQKYQGYRVKACISDKFGNSELSKIDIGVHKYESIKQDEWCFDVDFDNRGVTLFINSKEQIVAEKIKSLLIFGKDTTRFKDIYDIYYLLQFLDVNELKKTINTLIFSDNKMPEKSYRDIAQQINKVFNNSNFLNNLSLSQKNWLNIGNKSVLSSISKYLASLI